MFVWYGLHAPQSPPALLAAKFNNALMVTLKVPAFVKNMETSGAVIIDDRSTGMAEHKASGTSEINQ